MRTLSIAFALAVLAATGCAQIAPDPIPGVVRPMRRARVAAEVAGKIVERLFEENDRIERDAVILRLDDTLVRAGLAVAEAKIADADARLTWARRELARIRELGAKDAASRAALERAEADESMAQAARAAAEAERAARRFELEKSTIRAPFAGVLTEIHAEVGEYLSPGMPAFVVCATAPCKIESFVDADRARTLVVGKRVSVRDGDARLKARIRSIALASDNAARSFRVVLIGDDGEARDEESAFRVGALVEWTPDEDA